MILMHEVLIRNILKGVTSQASDQFILDSYVPVRDTNTGDIVSIKSTWDGESFTYEDSPSFFDKVARVFENRSIKEGHTNEN